MDEITINGERYIKESTIDHYIPPIYSDKSYSLIRAKAAGVFVGYIKKRSGEEVLIEHCRRIWYWSGAASISELATYGVKEPGKCKFSVVVPEQVVIGVIEIIPISEQAKRSIDSVREWRA